MPSLKELLGAPGPRPRVIADCARLIDAEVASKGGLSAVPIKLGFAAVKGVKPGFIPSAVDFLLDEFCDALDPFYQRWATSEPRAPLAQALNRDADAVSEALLAVTDRRAQRSTNAVVKKAYEKLRGSAKQHVKAALPGLGRTMEPYVRGEAPAA